MVFVYPVTQFDHVAADPALGSAVAARWQSHAPDAHLVARKGYAIPGHASLWWRDRPGLDGLRVGMIGHFGASHPEAASALLESACARLKAEGCDIAIGPIDGNTWRPYRFVTEQGNEPPFFMEPTNPPEWPAWWESHGFEPLSRYRSLLINDPGHREERVARAARRLADSGVTIRSISMRSFEADLLGIHDVSVVSFQNAFLYTPIAAPEFLSMYQPLRTRLNPALVQIAEHEGRVVGYLFGTIDFHRPQGDTAIGKTLAVLPGRAFAGLGLVLTERLHEAAMELGCSRVIHALQNDDNQVCHMSDRYGCVMRRYTLYRKQL